MLLAISAAVLAAPQNAKDDSQASPSAQTLSADLKVCVRTQEDSPFSGFASVHVTPSEGPELLGAPSGSAGETIFADVAAGTYTIEASAPGFEAVRMQTKIETGGGVQTVFVIMKPKTVSASASPLALPSVAPAAAASPRKTSWIPPGIDDVVPTVEAGTECPLAQVLSGAGQRMKEFVDNLQKFDATETLEHFNVDAAGSRGKPETRTFDYVVTITFSKAGIFLLDEYRNGSEDPSQFPAQIATTGLAAMALVVHPMMVSDFDFTCEGLGRAAGLPAWQIRFAQRADRPNRIRSYVAAGHTYLIPLKGRVWIDAGTYQVRRLEAELKEPVKEIALTKDYMAIDYGPVQFQAHKEELWLPHVAEHYVERKGRRYYRRHTFSNFKIFGVETAQLIQAPKESYCFKNTSDHEVLGTLTVSPVPESAAQVTSIQFKIPSGASVCKLVGIGKDVTLPADEVDSATFTHNGAPGSIIADANLVRASTLAIVP